VLGGSSESNPVWTAVNGVGPSGWNANVNEVTTPKLPPPPRIAQKRSGLDSADAVRTSPSAQTTCASTTPAPPRAHRRTDSTCAAPSHSHRPESGLRRRCRIRPHQGRVPTPASRRPRRPRVRRPGRSRVAARDRPALLAWARDPAAGRPRSTTTRRSNGPCRARRAGAHGRARSSHPRSRPRCRCREGGRRTAPVHGVEDLSHLRRAGLSLPDNRSAHLSAQFLDRVKRRDLAHRWSS
jgi:hypothetical protein